MAYEPGGNILADVIQHFANPLAVNLRDKEPYACPQEQYRYDGSRDP